MTIYVHGIDETFSRQLQVGRHLVGRGTDADIQLHDASVSKAHAEIHLADDGGIRVRDLGSTNSTFVGSEKVQEAVLRVGEEITFGNVRVKIDDSPVRIVVPKVEPPQRPEPSWMPDGHPACLLHPGVHAVYCCTRCGHAFCPDCVRRVGLTGKQAKFFCGGCSGECLPLEAEPRKLSAGKVRVRRILKKLDRFFAAKR